MKKIAKWLKKKQKTNKTEYLMFGPYGYCRFYYHIDVLDAKHMQTAHVSFTPSKFALSEN